MNLPRLLLLIALLSVASTRAAVRGPAVFSDHMVLQRERPVPVWGEADAGEALTIQFAGQRVSAVADAAGHWRATLTALPASAAGRELTIRGRETTLTFTDVLVGEVWFCSGQSNMEKPLGPRKGQKPTDAYEEELARADCPTLRLFQMPQSGKVKGTKPVMRWLACDAAALTGTDFSAAAYYFGRELVRELGVPVGLINSSFGGTRIEAWMPREALLEDPALRPLVDIKYAAWVPGVQPTELWTSMVTPFVPFALRGFLWYQGEANCMEADGSIYTAKMRALIGSWRTAWGEPGAPFYYALIAPFAYSAQKHWAKQLTPETLPFFWDAQIAALAVPHTGIVTTTDLVANVRDIHPTNKRDVGLRFARLALADNYGRSNVDAFPPRFVSFRPKPGTREIELTLANAASLHTREGKAPDEFMVAGADRQFYAATAVIASGGRVDVSSAKVETPVAVRMAWHETANPNLVNGAGLPALPFRTDDWPVIVEVPKEKPAVK